MRGLDDLSRLPRWQRDALDLGYEHYRGSSLWERISWSPPVPERLSVWVAGYLGRDQRLRRVTSALHPLHRVGERVEALGGLVRRTGPAEAPPVRWSPEARVMLGLPEQAMVRHDVLPSFGVPPPVHEGLVIRAEDVERHDPGPIAREAQRIAEGLSEAYAAMGRRWLAELHAAWVAAGCPMPSPPPPAPPVLTELDYLEALDDGR